MSRGQKDIDRTGLTPVFVTGVERQWTDVSARPNARVYLVHDASRLRPAESNQSPAGAAGEIGGGSRKQQSVSPEHLEAHKNSHCVQVPVLRTRR